MPFNVKTRRAMALWESLLAKPAGQRHGATGFWRASLPKVRAERLLRVAYLPERRFVFEADIDPHGTHTMTSSRIEEYLEHERFKLSGFDPSKSIDQIVEEIRGCIAQGRIVVAFHDARPFDRGIGYTGQNPLWYTSD